MNEIFYRRDKKGWVAYDRNGNSASAATKQLAHNQYILLYGANGNISSNTVDINKFNLKEI